MTSESEMRRYYQQMSPGEKARLALKCRLDGTPTPTGLLSGMSRAERGEYILAGQILNMAHFDAEIELRQIEAECREALQQLTSLERTRWELLTLVELRSLLDRAKEPYTDSEYARLIEDAEQELIPVDELLEEEVSDQLEKEGFCASEAQTDTEYRGKWNRESRKRWRKREKELMELINSGRLEAERIDGRVLVRWGSWCEITGQELSPLDHAAEARVFPDEMADTVEEMQRESAALRARMAQAFTSVLEQSDPEVRSSAWEFLGFPGCLSHPERDAEQRMNHTFSRDILPMLIIAWRRQMANLEAVFKRIGDKEFGGAEIVEARVADRLAMVKLMVSELASQLGVEETTVVADEEIVEESFRRLTGRATPTT